MDDAFGFAAVELDAFALLEASGFDEVLTVDGPERVRRRATDRLGLAFDLQVDYRVGNMRERSGYDGAGAGLNRDVFVDVG